MIVVDSSAVVAILFDELSAPALLARLAADPDRGKLNFGDVFSYALARTQKAPLLFIGDDFGTTDVTAADVPQPHS